MADYFFSKSFVLSFDETIDLIKSKLPESGFGVISEIDIKESLKKKLDVDFRNYKILGACHPPTAYAALQVEDKIGTMLPCNIIVQEVGNGITEVAAVDPVASMAAVQNMLLAEYAYKIRKLLKEFIDNL